MILDFRVQQVLRGSREALDCRDLSVHRDQQVLKDHKVSKEK